jgi:hypothetical protein
MFPVPRRPQETATTDGVSRLVRSNETMLISHGDQRLWLQGGRIYDDAGLEISGENVPGWFQEEYEEHLDKLTKQQILQLIDDEELEVENSTKMKKEELIAAVIEARVNKSANTGQPPDENDDK